MEIIRAEHSGFCFGVKKAITIAEEAAEEMKSSPSGVRTYTLGPIIHNRAVTDELRQKGLLTADSIEEIQPGSNVIVRSHGEPLSFYEEAEARGLSVIDATCPFVARIHDLVNEAEQDGRNIIVVGDRDHPEVIGINGWCRNNALIIGSPEEAETAPLPFDDAVCVSQTTMERGVFDRIVETLERRGVRIERHDTICGATTERQNAAFDLANRVDAMIVIGDKSSSNTGKLVSICRKCPCDVYFVQNYEDLPLKQLGKYNKIGVAAGASTPEREIKEVITNMSDNITNEKNDVTMEDLMEEIDQSLKLPRSGDIVKGKVDQVNDKEVIVNLGCKKDGILYPSEVSLEDDQTLTDVFKVGDEIEAKVIKTDDNDGGLLLSKKKLEISKHWQEIQDAYENGTTIYVKVMRVVNGGVVASYKEASGFIPLSKLSNRFVEDASEFVGQELAVKVMKVEQRRGNRAVFSHKDVLKEEMKEKEAAIWKTLHEGDIVEGTVMRFTEYGAFVDLGGIDGLLHISEISWGKLHHPDEVLKEKQKINVKILKMDESKGKISLGLKQTTPEPWSVIDEKYHVDDIIEGKVVQIKDYGAFIELEPGLDGLVHISEVANKHVNNINDELEIGQKVNAKILEIDQERKRISLSLKEAPGNEKPAEEEAPAEEAPAKEEAPKEEAPAEEAPKEEAPAAEAPAEEPKEEAPAEEEPKEEAPAEEEAPKEEE